MTWALDLGMTMNGALALEIDVTTDGALALDLGMTMNGALALEIDVTTDGTRVLWFNPTPQGSNVNSRG
jgi:hypothetical protein